MNLSDKPEPDRPKWPKDVAPISYGDMDRLGVGPDGRLYWDGKPVEVQRRLRFSRLQTVGALIVGLAAVVGGIGTGLNEGFDLGCKLHLWTQPCLK